jgi:hypothetical protein
MKIMCATELLPKSEAALSRAGLLADALGADLTVLHVVSAEASAAKLEERLQTALRQMRWKWNAMCSSCRKDLSWPRSGIVGLRGDERAGRSRQRYRGNSTIAPCELLCGPAIR